MVDDTFWQRYPRPRGSGALDLRVGVSAGWPVGVDRGACGVPGRAGAVDGAGAGGVRGAARRGGGLAPLRRRPGWHRCGCGVAGDHRPGLGGAGVAAPGALGAAGHDPGGAGV